MKAGNLVKILETSERTIYRDIDILCEAGIPIMSVPGPAGGYSFMQGYKINSNALNTGNIFNLLLSSMGIKPEKNTETAQQLQNAVIKLENSVSPEHREEIIKAKERFFIDSDPWWKKSKQQFARQSSTNVGHNNYPVKVKLYEEKKQLLEGFYVISSIRAEDKWLYNIDMISFETAYSVIFPYSDRMEVLEPVELRKYIISKTKKS